MKGYNHNDYMDSALAPIEAQRDDALEELAKVQAENAALLAALEVLVSRGKRHDGRRWMDKHYEAALAAIAKAKGGE